MNDMNDVLNKFKQEREELMKTFTEGYKKLIKDKDEELEKMFKDKNQELETAIMEVRSEFEDLEYINLALCIKLRQSNDEIQEAHQELITGLRDLSDESSKIRVKKMGQVDKKPFLKVCKQKFSGPSVTLQSARFISKWEKRIMDPLWHPFKIQRCGDKTKGVVDEDDEKLKNLSLKWGEDVKNAVKTALEEMNEFNASGRFVVPVLWNFEHGRKATLKEEIVAHMKHQINNLKRKRT